MDLVTIEFYIYTNSLNQKFTKTARINTESSLDAALTEISKVTWNNCDKEKYTETEIR